MNVQYIRADCTLECRQLTSRFQIIGVLAQNPCRGDLSAIEMFRQLARCKVCVFNSPTSRVTERRRDFRISCQLTGPIRFHRYEPYPKIGSQAKRVVKLLTAPHPWSHCKSSMFRCAVAPGAILTAREPALNPLFRPSCR